MKAIIRKRYGGPEVLDLAEVEPPVPAPDEVLVRVVAASLNSADDRLMQADPFLVRLENGLTRPKKWFVLGGDVAGVVESVGERVERFAPGDAVFGTTFPDGLGALAELVRVREDTLVEKPASFGFEEAAAVPLAGITALQGLRDAGAVRSGESVLIQGAGGGVGHFAVQIARSLGARVTAVCGAGSIDLAKRGGAEEVIDYESEDFTKSGRRWDVIVAVNGYHPLPSYKRCLEPGGRCVVIGGHNRVFFEAMFLGAAVFAFGGKSSKLLKIDDDRRGDDLARLREMLLGGELEPAIDRVFPMQGDGRGLPLHGAGSRAGQDRDPRRRGVGGPARPALTLARGRCSVRGRAFPAGRS